MRPSGHLWPWREVVGSAYGFDSHYLIAQDGRGRPIAAAPFIFVRSFLYGSELSSMPYLDYGGVCHADSLDAAGRGAADAELIAHARELASKLRAKRLHIRSLTQMHPPFEISTEKVAQHLALAPTVDEQLRRLPSERRNRLKRIEKLGLSVEVSDPTDAGGAGGFVRDLFREHARPRIADARPPILQPTRELPCRDWLSLIRVRSSGQRGRGRARDEFPRLDDTAVVGRDRAGAPGVREQRALLAGDTTGDRVRLPYL